jgi:hypothetical protein
MEKITRLTDFEKSTGMPVISTTKVICVRSEVTDMAIHPWPAIHQQ